MSAVDVIAIDDLPPGTMQRVDVGGYPVCLANVAGTVHAVHDTCTHGRASLSEGYLDDEMGRVECPRHGGVFRLSDGGVVTPPPSRAQPVFPVEVRDGRVWVTPEPDTQHPFHTP